MTRDFGVRPRADGTMIREAPYLLEPRGGGIGARMQHGRSSG